MISGALNDPKASQHMPIKVLIYFQKVAQVLKWLKGQIRVFMRSETGLLLQKSVQNGNLGQTTFQLITNE
jgi:hypothetical protein